MRGFLGNRRRVVLTLLALYAAIGLTAVVWMAVHYPESHTTAVQTQPASRPPGFWRYWMLQREMAPIDLQQ